MGGMKSITRAVGLEDLRDLVDAPPRAYLAYVARGRRRQFVFGLRQDAGRWFVTLPPGLSIADGTRVVLLIDDGEFYFELRGIRVRGTSACRRRRNARSRPGRRSRVGTTAR